MSFTTLSSTICLWWNWMRNNFGVWIIPAAYFCVYLIWISFCLPYFWFNEIFTIFFLILLFLYSEFNKYFKFQFSEKNGVDILSDSVRINVMLIFLINFFFIVFLRFGLGANNWNYESLKLSENGYLGSSIAIDSCRIFITFLFVVNLWYASAYTKFKKNLSYEFYLLLGLLCGFTLLCVSCKNFFLLFLLIEGISFMLVGLVCFSNSKTGFEVSLKFFVLSGIFTIIGFLGCSIVYGCIHTLDFRAARLISSALASRELLFSSGHVELLNFGVLLIFISLLFKLGSFPFHSYVADYASESLYPLLFFFLVPLKIGFFYVLTSIFITFVHMQGYASWVFLFCGLSSIVVGAKCAVGETELKKFLAFTSINQFGFALLALTVPSFLAVAASYVFVVVYGLSMVLFFFVPMRSFSKYNSEAFLFMNHFAYYNYFSTWRFGQAFPRFSSLMVSERFSSELRLLLVIFSLIGFPPLPGFGAKFLIFFVLIYYHHIVVVFFVLLVSLISAYYYINIVYKIFNKSESASFELLQNYFKFAKNSFMDVFQVFVAVMFFLMSFVILDINFLIGLADVLFASYF